MSLVCGCDIFPDYFINEWKTARIEHHCEECHKTIMPGELYCRSTALWEGRWAHHKCCEKCQDLADSMAAMGYCIVEGELHEAHQEYLREVNPPKLEGR